MTIQIVIPMSGYGERFKKAGYKVPKPLIIVEGKPIISHIIDLFPGEKNFFFICNKKHIQNKKWKLRSIIKKYLPTAKIISIDPHKLGPVHAVNLAYKYLDPSLPIIINYCDFTCLWDWKFFKKKISSKSYDGAIPAYRGFHPHSSGQTNYAYIKEKKLILNDIQEKNPFTKNKVNEYTSSGTYFFSSAKLMFDAFQYVKKKNLHIQNEFYVSLAYKYLLKKNKKTLIFPLKYFMQWGTPQDLEEYEYYSSIFKNILKVDNKNCSGGTNIIPMAGLGKRFKKEKYKTIKPLIPVLKKPMCLRSIQSLPKANKNLIIVRSKIVNKSNIVTVLKKNLKNTYLKIIYKKTDGQARTVKIGIEDIKKNEALYQAPYTIGTCDSAIVYNKKAYQEIIQDTKIDLIIWVKNNYPHAFKNPFMYGWIRKKNQKNIKISIKKPFKIINKKTDSVITGVFTFKNIYHALDAINNLIDNNTKVNGEYYMDSCIDYCINSGLNCKIIDVDSYISWGTPKELETFNYWKDCFNLWKDHPYNNEKKTIFSEI
jgi:bifunctional N-acetylglucosamine-1-phosphate-uridyltransferase/glucosamine-1-phosphate-acetyltransferase GlmU-like protein